MLNQRWSKWKMFIYSSSVLPCQTFALLCLSHGAADTARSHYSRVRLTKAAVICAGRMYADIHASRSSVLIEINDERKRCEVTLLKARILFIFQQRKKRELRKFSQVAHILRCFRLFSKLFRNILLFFVWSVCIKFFTGPLFKITVTELWRNMLYL